MIDISLNFLLRFLSFFRLSLASCFNGSSIKIPPVSINYCYEFSFTTLRLDGGMNAEFYLRKCIDVIRTDSPPFAFVYKSINSIKVKFPN